MKNELINKKPRACSGFFIYNKFMKNNLISSFVKLALILLISTNVYSGGDDEDSLIQETLDMVLVDEYKPCSDQSDFDSTEINTATSLMLLSGDAIFAEGDEIISSNNTRAIVSSYNIKTNELMYYQTAKTGFKSFLIGEKITSTSSDTGVSSIKEFVNDFIVPCSELIVSIEENPQQMVFIFADSAAAIKAKIAAQEMMAEIIAEEERAKRLAEFQAKLEAEKAAAARSNAIYQARLQQEQMIKDRQAQLALERELAAFEAQLAEDLANQAALEAFQQKLADEKAAAAKSNAAYQSKLENDAKVAALMEELALEQEIAAFEAQLRAELAAQEMMAEIIAEEELAKRLAEFQAKLEAEKAAAARSNAIYQARLQQEQMIKERQAQLALERELAAFEAQLEAELAQEAVEREIAEFEAEYEAQQALLMEQMAVEKELAAFEAKLEAELAAEEMMAEIIAEEERAKRLAEFQAKLEAEKAAAAASTAAYQAKVAYDARIDKILQDLVVKLEEVMTPDDYKSILVEELIEEATAKLEEEKFIGAISGEIVTVAIHEFCKDNLNLSDSNIELFKKALVGGYLGNVGPQIDAGTEFTANRWDKYITCVGSEGN